MERQNLFNLNDSPVNFTLENELDFQLNQEDMNFSLNALSPLSGETFYRILEDSDNRITENGDFRVLE